MKSEITLEDITEYSNSKYYDVEFMVKRGKKEVVVSATLCAMWDDNSSSAEYEFDIVNDNEVALSVEEVAKMKELAIESEQK